jgi:glycosyltransferase involved in cell wall biosynthesis
MGFKSIARKAKVGLRVLREQGVLGLMIVALQFIQKKVSKKHAERIHAIYTKAKYEDIVEADLYKRPKKWPGTDRKSLRLNWLMPPPGRGSGGHLNIFRFIKYLEDAGHECRIYVTTFDKKGSVAAIRAVMGDSYPKVAAPMKWIDGPDEMEEADGILPTSWETAYPAYNFAGTAKRFYFIQDFEPFFYPVGSLYTLAENTYKFGFYGVTAGNWLSTKLRRDYGMQTDNYDFGSESSLYSYANDKPRKEILFYARPYTERRGFEMGIMALDLFHRKHPDFVINMAGYDISSYKIPFTYQNLKTLELEQLNDLYNRCAAGLVMSFTNMSLLPLELLGSGTIPVVNDGENNRLVSDNKYIAYAPADPASIANALSEIVARKDLPDYAKKASESVKATNWDEAGKKFVSIIEREIRKSE